MNRVWVAFSICCAVLAPISILGWSPPAHACVDFVDPRPGTLGSLPMEGFAGDIAVTGDGALLTGGQFRQRVDLDGTVEQDYNTNLAAEDVIAVDDGDAVFVFGNSVERFIATGDPVAGYPVSPDVPSRFGVRSSGEMGIAPARPPGLTGTTLEGVARFTADGAPDTSFGNDGVLDVVVPRPADVPTSHELSVLGVRPVDTGVELLVHWSTVGTGAWLQLVAVADDGTPTTRGLLAFPDRWVVATMESTASDEWPLFAEVADFPGAPSLVHVVVVGADGTIAVRHVLPALARGYFQNGENRILVDPTDGVTYVSVGGALIAVADSGPDPMQTNRLPGQWSTVRDVDSFSLTNVIAGLALGPGGEVFLSWRGNAGSTAVFALRGTQAPSEFVVGALSDQVARLYRAALGRPADASGLEFWRRERARGVSMERLAARFLGSAEFQANFGGLDDRAFVEQLYLFVLGRPGESSGVDFWTDRLAQGIDTRASLLAFFADSDENVIRTGTLRPAGVEGQLHRLYRAVFLRAPDVNGNCFWLLGLGEDRTLHETADFFVGSDEFQTRYGQLDDAGFVDLLYRNVLGRPADPDGLAFWTDRLTAGWSRGDVVIGFAESAEFRLATDT